MTDQNDQFVTEGEQHPTLGPNYFAGRAIAERFMAQFQEEHFKPLVDQFVGKFRDELWTKIADWMLVDTESNLQGAIWDRIDRSVEAILSGQPWALQRYAITPRYDGDKIRAAIAKHIPDDVLQARIAELEKENTRLSETIERMNRRY